MNVLPQLDYDVFEALASHEDAISIETLAEQIQSDQAKVTAVCLFYSSNDRGEITLSEEIQREFRLGNKSIGFVGQSPIPGEVHQSSFPERKIIHALFNVGGRVSLTELPDLTLMEQKEVGQTLRWLKQKGWAEQEGKELVLTSTGKTALNQRGADEMLFEAIVVYGVSTDAELRNRGIDLDAALALLKGRPGIIDEKERKHRKVMLSVKGRDLVHQGIQPRQQINQLTDELLRTGAWRNVELRPYDVAAVAEARYAAKDHPLVRVLEKTRRVFLEMGFTETSSSYVESSFWDFDALFQPQDHPARDMQDTFYIARPETCELPDEDLVQRVQRTHEHGGDTHSIGWRYRWNRSLAQRPVLRTHMTAATIRALAAEPKSPRKVFSVGPVFRRETIDYKHLPVFHQVDGIIIDEQASFATLLGTLQAFYRKMGFSRWQFRPAFFPYTEPSVEVFVWSESKGDWVEMGGAGMFRPEVTQPLGCTVPVLAWGLGLERLAMFSYQLASIGELYRARLSWLKETPLCR